MSSVDSENMQHQINWGTEWHVWFALWQVKDPLPGSLTHTEKNKIKFGLQDNKFDHFQYSVARLLIL